MAQERGTPPSFADYRPEDHPIPPGMSVVGEGGVGGKALGLFLAATLQHRFSCDIAGRYTPLLRIPPTTVLRSGCFDRFVAHAGLAPAIAAYAADPRPGLEAFEELRAAFLAAPLAPACGEMYRQLVRDRDYPLAVRSSSLLEDSQRASFAGIYHTCFIPNVGTIEQRLRAFEGAVKEVYASTYNPDAMAYRAKRGVSWRDERMCVLAQRLVGRRRGKYFFPVAAGVAFSRNYYPWTDRLRPEDGVVRLVYGLGTQAVGRGYARVLSPAWPSLRPEGEVVQDIRRYSQSVFDALDLSTGKLVTLPIADAGRIDRDVWKLASVLEEGSYLKEIIGRPDPGAQLVMTFRRAIQGHYPLPFVPLLVELLRRLEELYGLPVDVEFGLTESEEPGPGEGTFHLLQVRPLTARADHERVELPEVPPERLLVSSNMAVGNGVVEGLRHLVVVSPEHYGRVEQAHVTAREVGRLNGVLAGQGYVLVGPGRWGTQNAALGVPVSYAEICHARMVVEVSGGPYAPEFSYGTHFFGDLTSDRTPYLAVFPDRGDVCRLDELFAEGQETRSPSVRLVELPAGLVCAVSGARRRGLIYRVAP